MRTCKVRRREPRRTKKGRTLGASPKDLKQGDTQSFSYHHFLCPDYWEWETGERGANARLSLYEFGSLPLPPVSGGDADLFFEPAGEVKWVVEGEGGRDFADA